MMAWTDRHCRHLHRLVAPHALLFTEMVTSAAVVHGPSERLLRYHPAEHPVALQLGGSDPAELAAAARLAAEAGFDEINLNVGCPSPRVRQGRFGACLMREPELVGDCVAAMNEAVPVPVTVKCRLGVDDHDDQEALERFVATVAQSACRTFYVHARKALLNGLSPAENRTIPPLDYGRVYALKQCFPELEIVLNGGITRADEVSAHLKALDGVMVGRAAYHQPMVLAAMERRLFAPSPTENASHGPAADSRSGDGPQRMALQAFQIMERYRAYMVGELARGVRLSEMTRHALGLFAGMPGARRFRRTLSDAARLKCEDIALVDQALSELERRPVGNRAA